MTKNKNYEVIEELKWWFQQSDNFSNLLLLCNVLFNNYFIFKITFIIIQFIY